jgi:hypothetical protein
VLAASSLPFFPRHTGGPVDAAEVDRVMILYQRAAKRGDSFIDAMRYALKGVLVAPSFLFRSGDATHGPDSQCAVGL